MALTAYLGATNRLLQNPVPTPPLYTTADLTAYINTARTQLAGDAECIRANATQPLVFTVNKYAFSGFGTFTSGGAALTGIASVLTIRQLMITLAANGNVYPVYGRSWEWLQRYYIATGGAAISPGRPKWWAQQGRGDKGTLMVSPVPIVADTMTADVCCLPIPLVDDTTAEAIPYAFTDSVPYYAAYMALLSSQRTQDATTMLARYREFVQRAIEMDTPTRFPGNFPGGRGAQMASSKQSLTEKQQAQR